jgi:hypothetical protein
VFICCYIVVLLLLRHIDLFYFSLDLEDISISSLFVSSICQKDVSMLPTYTIASKYCTLTLASTFRLWSMRTSQDIKLSIVLLRHGPDLS